MCGQPTLPNQQTSGSVRDPTSKSKVKNVRYPRLCSDIHIYMCTWALCARKHTEGRPQKYTRKEILTFLSAGPASSFRPSRDIANPLHSLLGLTLLCTGFLSILGTPDSFKVQEKKANGFHGGKKGAHAEHLQSLAPCPGRLFAVL